MSDFSLEIDSTGHRTESELQELGTEKETGLETGNGQGLGPFYTHIGDINNIKYIQEILEEGDIAQGPDQDIHFTP